MEIGNGLGKDCVNCGFNPKQRLQIQDQICEARTVGHGFTMSGIQSIDFDSRDRMKDSLVVRGWISRVRGDLF